MATSRDGEAGRQQGHLSADRDTAIDVGGRHGKPIVIEVDASGLNADGGRFHLAANGVWLIGRVEPRYLTIPDRPSRATAQRRSPFPDSNRRGHRS